MKPRILEIQVKAILARFGGDYDRAAEYCVQMMNTYPALYTEYGRYLEELNYAASFATVGSRL
jgi:hypothetical protein